jgi:hypothetical protein
MSEQGSGVGGGRNRRLWPRYNVGLVCEISLPEGEQSSVLLFPGEKIGARTRDVSAQGLGVVAPTIYLGYDCLVDQGRTLRITLRLPTGPVEMSATAAHYLRQDTGGGESSYFIGLHITGMGEEDRALYDDFLGGLTAA